MLNLKLWKVTENRSTSDDVTGTPIGPEFTGSPIKRVRGVFLTRDAANAAADLMLDKMPPGVSVSVGEVTF